MSNLVFPTLGGMDIKVKRTPVWSTEVLGTQSGKEQRAAWWSAPRFKYSLTFNYLRQGLNADEAARLAAFFNQHKGSWDSFLFVDPYEVNLVPNGNSEDANPTGYAAAGIISTFFRSGTKSRIVNGFVAGVSQYIQVAQCPVTAGELLYGETWCNSSGDASGWMDLTFFDASGSQIGVRQTSNQASHSWGVSSGVLDAPAGAVSVNVYLATRSASGTAATYHDDFVLRRMAFSTDTPDGTNLIADGANQRFLRRVRFDMDEMDLERFLMGTAQGGGQTWEAKTVKLISVK